MSAPKKNARRASDSRPVRRKESATTDVFARHVDSTRVKKGEADASIVNKPTTANEELSAKTTTEDAVPRKATSMESAPIGLRKASIPESGPAMKIPRGGDFARSAPVPRSGPIAKGTRENESIKVDTRKHKRISETIAVPKIAKSGPITIKLQARWRRALRRAG